LVSTTQTKLTDECTEFQATISNMQTSFADELHKIKQDNEKNRKATEERMKHSEQEYIKAQEAMLGEYKTINKKYTKMLESFSTLSSDLHKAKLEQDQCHMGMKESFGAMMQILININQSLANGTHPEPLQQDHIASIMNNIQELNRDRASGTETTKSSLATLQGGGQQN
jgi:hypothetical protein